jgi:hypothetical protein
MNSDVDTSAQSSSIPSDDPKRDLVLAQQINRAHLTSG